MRKGMAICVLMGLLFIGSTAWATLELDYEDLVRSVDAGRIRSTVEYLSSFESRVVGYPGCDEAARYIQGQFEEIGLMDVRSEEFEVSIPVDHGASLRVVGEDDEIRLHCLWPNLVRTSTLPKDGIQGHLIYGKSGQFVDLNGKDVEGSITLMDFNTWNNWLNVGMLGTQAVIFIEPDSTVHLEAEQKFLQVPLSVERFWISKEDARILLDRMKHEDLQVEMKARMIWEKRPAWNILGAIPGTDPVLRDDIIVLESYYDAMSVVPALAPGAEMSSGITALLELARFFHDHLPTRTIVFVATSAHHLGLRGVDAFLQQHCRREEHFMKRVKDPIDIKLFIGLDLSTQTDELGVWNSSSSFYYKRYFAPFGKNFMRLSKEVCRGLGYDPKNALVNGISPEGGMSWQTFIPGEIVVDSELVLVAGTPALSFVTVNDARFRVDTPLDVASQVNFGNLTRQIRFLAGVFSKAFDDPELFPDFKMRLKDTLKTLKADIMTFRRRGISPDLPRPGAVAILRNGRKKSYKGVRGEYYELVDEEGRCEFSRIRVNAVGLEAYYMDPATGHIEYAPNQGSQGAAIYKLRFSMDWWEKGWMIVLFPCISTDFYDIVDPRYLTKLTTVTIFDHTNAAPEEYGYAIGYGPTEPVGVIFTRPRTRVKVAMSSGIIGIRLLLLNSTSSEDKEVAKGEGYLTEDHGSIAMTSFKAAKDMWSLDEARMQELKKFAIENDRLTMLHNSAREQIDLAEKAMQERKWDDFMKHTRAALGIESRAYPDVKTTQNDVIQGIIFYMALLLPCAFFAERLIFTFADIRKQLAGFGFFFILIWAVLWWVHPAFELSNPAVVLLAFVILALAVIVIFFVSSRFNEQMRKMRTETAVLHETDVGRVSASAAAFSIGISNMKRRKVRTSLTFMTLLLLTFTVLSFTSIKSRLKFNQISRDNEGLYRGALMRSRAWNPLEQAAYDYALSAFQDIADVAPRTWYISKQKNYVKVKKEEKSANALGVLGLTPGETKVTGIDRCLVKGRWFQPGDRKVCIIPNDMAKADLLDIDIDREVGTVQVRVFGEMFTVIGILDSKKMKELRDLDDEILTPADFQLTGGQAIQELAEQEQQESAGLEDPKLVIRPFVHLEPANVLVLPYDVLRDVSSPGSPGSGCPLQSVAIKFDEGVNVQENIERFITRLAVTMFAGIEDERGESIEVSVYSSLGFTSFRGLKNLFIPILIASLIVLNTMMGSVYERFREIGIYSSVGLAPTHIAFLFIAESCVYAVLGTVAGYLVGQMIAKLLLWQGWLGGFSLNYSSLSAVTSSILVMAVVILSTVYPARKASQMAVPDVTRKWRIPEPEGDEWHFDFPFTVGGTEVFGLCVFLVGYFDSYSEESIGIFYTDGAKLSSFDTEKGEGYSIEMNLWLAPFDLGVSEYVLFRAVPSGEHNVYDIKMDIRRLSGEDASWKRVNERFVNVIRKQFLIWRTVSPEAKEEYREEGRRLLAGGAKVA